MKPLLSVIFAALEERGWTVVDGEYVDPEGKRHLTVLAAVTAQTFREIAAQDARASSEE
jgi:hypothetical protein